MENTQKKRSYRLMRHERGGILLESVLLMSLIAVTCISAISAMTKGGVMLAFCKLMHSEPSGQVLIDDGRFDLETGDCVSAGGANDAWDFDWDI